MRTQTAQQDSEPVSVQPLTENLSTDDEKDIVTPFDDAPEPAEKRRGRPVGSGKSPAPPAKKFKYFPIPPRKVVGVNKEWGQEEFLKYWRKVAADPDLRDRAVCYVYRTYPVTNVNPPAENADEAGAQKPKYLDVTSQPFENQEDVWRRYGAGDYKFFLNDADFPGRAKTQMTCYFTGTREWEQYPPQIDLKTLDMADPKNGTYIRYLQQKNLLPKENEEDDVSTRLADTVDTLTTKIVDMASRQPAPAPAYQPPTINAASEAVAAVTRSFADANKVQMQMLSDAVDKATAVQARTQDPFEMLAKVMATMREMYPKADNSALEATLRASLERSAALEERLSDMQASLADQRIKDLEARLAERQAQQQQPSAPPKSIFDQAREFAELQRELKSIFGSGKETSDDDEEGGDRRRNGDREPWYAKHLPGALGFAAFLVAGVNAFMHNKAVAATGQGQPAHPPQPPPEIVPPQIQQAAAAIANPNGQEQQPTMDTRAAQVQMLIRAIETPLARHLEDNRSGREFAAWFIDSYGEAVYREVISTGDHGILSAIAQYAPGLFAKLQATPTVSQQFILEFLQGPQEEE